MSSFEARVIHNEMYPATYNFKDEVDGTSGTDIDFVDAVSTAANTTIVASWQNHRKVLRQTNTGSNSNCDHNFSGTDNKTAGIVEYWIGSSDVTKYTLMYFNDDTVPIIDFRIHDSKWKEYSGGANNIIAGALAVVNNTLYHIKIQWYADNTWDLWIDGTQYLNGKACRDNMSDGIDKFRLHVYDTTSYLDAFGESWDASYNIGDNVYHRHYKDQDSDFENEDAGTSGTTIACVDGGNDSTHCEIVPEFNAHKKVLRFFDDDGSSDFYIGLTQATADIVELHLKVTDATTHFKLYFCEDAVQCFYLKIENDNLYDTDDGDIGDIADVTWYVLRVQWYADNTYDVYLNGVFILDGDAMDNNQTSGINRLHIYGYGNDNTKFIYLDAISQISISGNEIGDNLTYDYNAYSYDDDTANVIDCIGRVFGYDYRDLYIGFANSDYDKALHFFQIYDKDGILGFEGDIKIETQDGSYRGYYCLSKNKSDMEAQQNETFTTAKIYEMLQTLMPFTNSRLHLGDYDLDATTYSPTIINLPRIQCLQTLGYAGNKVIRIKANGIIEYHSGTATGLSITEASGEMSTAPLVKLLQDTFTKVTVYGGVNPDSSVKARFSGSAGSGEPEFWKTLTHLSSDADCASMATQILLGFATPKKILIKFQGIGAYSAYDTLVFEYSVGDLTISSATWYILYERIDYCTAIGDFVLSNGVLESGEYNLPTHTRDEEVSDDVVRTFADTDIITFYPSLVEAGGGTKTYTYVQLDAVNENARISFFTTSFIDDARAIILVIVADRIDANADTIDMKKTLIYKTTETHTSYQIIHLLAADTFPACDQNENISHTITIAAADVHANSHYQFNYYLNEAGRELYIREIGVIYYMKRSV